MMTRFKNVFHKEQFHINNNQPLNNNQPSSPRAQSMQVGKMPMGQKVIPQADDRGLNRKELLQACVVEVQAIEREGRRPDFNVKEVREKVDECIAGLEDIQRDLDAAKEERARADSAERKVAASRARQQEFAENRERILAEQAEVRQQLAAAKAKQAKHKEESAARAARIAELEARKADREVKKAAEQALKANQA